MSVRQEDDDQEDYCDDVSASIDSTSWSVSTLSSGSQRDPSPEFDIQSSEGQQATGFHEQKSNDKASCRDRNTAVIKPRTQCAELSCVEELQNQVCYLQNQLSEARRENKQLERMNHRCMVALHHFQELEEILPQTLAKHENESRALKEMLRGAHTCRDKVARQLQSSNNTLLETQGSLQDLQLLNQDHRLLEREKFTRKLEKVTAEVDRKNKRILDLEKNLRLCQASFSHHIEMQKRKTNEASKTNIYLEQQIYYLRQNLQDTKKKLKTHNIDYHRFPKGWSKKDRESKMDPQNELPPSETEESFGSENPQTEVLENEGSEDNHLHEAERHADN